MLRRLACAVVFVPSLAVAQDAQQGREIAQRWCSSCHLVDRAATGASADGLPTFPAIAAKPDLSADYLRAAMNPQHSRMPDFALSKRQQDDLIAYIYSLRRQGYGHRRQWRTTAGATRTTLNGRATPSCSVTVTYSPSTKRWRSKRKIGSSSASPGA